MQEYVNHLIVHTTSEFDAIKQDFNGYIYIDSVMGDFPIHIKETYLYPIIITGTSHVVVWGNTTIIAMDNSTILAQDEALVYATNNALISARGNSKIITNEPQNVHLSQNAKIVSGANVSENILKAIAFIKNYRNTIST